MKLVAGRTRNALQFFFMRRAAKPPHDCTVVRVPRPRPSSAPVSWPPAPEPCSVPCQPAFRTWKASLYFVQVISETAEHEIQTADSSPVPGRLPGKQPTALKGTGGAWAEAHSTAPCQPLSPNSLWSGTPHVRWTEQPELCFLENTEIQESNLFQFSLNYYIFPQF